MKRTDEFRFWKYVDQDTPYGPDGDCWRWTASVDKTGHGRFRAWGAQPGAHRFSFVLHGGTLPPVGRPHDACVLHTCDMRDCVNPEHLYLGPQGVNVDDREARKPMQIWRRLAFRRDKLPSLKPRTLSEELVRRIRQDPRSQSAIAAELGVGQPTISRIKSGKAWKHVT